MLIFIDLDGVIIDSKQYKIDLYRKFLVKEKIGSEISDETIINSVRPSDFFSQNFAKMSQLIKDFTIYKDKTVPKADRFITDEELASLSEGNVLVLFTAQKLDYVKHNLKNLSIFNEIITSEVIKHTSKTESDIIAKYQKKYKSKTSIFIGDSNDDISAAKKYHITSGFVTWGYSIVEQLSTTPDRIFNNKIELFDYIDKHKSNDIKIGCCCSIKDSNIIKNMGYDFIELKANEIVEYEETFFAVNSFIPRSLSIYDENKLVYLLNYTREIIQKCKIANAKIITLGSGKSRMIKSKNISESEKKLWTNFLKYLDKIAANNSVKIGIEPLNKDESNFINTIEEAYYWIKILDLKHFGITIDSFHFYKEHISINEAYKYKDYIIHAHISDRYQANPQKIDNNLKEYLSFIKQINCNISIEIVPYKLEYIKNKTLKLIRKELSYV